MGLTTDLHRTCNGPATDLHITVCKECFLVNLLTFMKTNKGVSLLSLHYKYCENTPLQILFPEIDILFSAFLFIFASACYRYALVNVGQILPNTFISNKN